MSVINDMLRDLEARKAPGSDGTVSAAQVEALIEPKSESNKAALIGGAVVVLILIAIVIWLLGDDKQEVTASIESPVVESTPKPESSPVSNQNSSLVQNNAANEQLKSEASNVSQSSPTKSKASRTSQQDIASSAVTGSSKKQATSDQVSKQTHQSSAAVEKPKSKPESAVTTKQTSKPKPRTVTQTNATKKSVRPAVAPTPAEEPKAPKQISASALDSKNASEAQALFQQGQDTLAYAQLQTFIAENAENIKSRTVLLTYLMRDQKWQEAERVLSTLPVEDDPALRQMKARLLVATGAPDEGIQLLHANLPLIDEYPDYYALLASYYQQFGYVERAIEFYTRLVEFDNQSANWWAGLGIALDSSGAYSQAKVAYEQATRLPGLKPQLMNFITDRLKAY